MNLIGDAINMPFSREKVILFGDIVLGVPIAKLFN